MSIVSILPYLKKASNAVSLQYLLSLTNLYVIVLNIRQLNNDAKIEGLVLIHVLYF